MPCRKEQRILLSLMDKYKDMPFLWKRDHEHYLNKDMRAKGFKVLLKIYKNYDENATEKNLKKKIENMRTSYSKELKKVLASKHSDSGANEVYSYVPTLWYFNALNFLSNETECDHNVTLIDTDPFENVNSSSDDDTLANASFAISDCGGQEKQIMDTPLLYEAETNLARNSRNDEEFDVYGRSIGFQMKDLNKRQLMISQKIISDVLYYAKLEQLSEYSCLVLEPSNESVIPNITKFKLYSMK